MKVIFIILCVKTNSPCTSESNSSNSYSDSAPIVLIDGDDRTVLDDGEEEEEEFRPPKMTCSGSFGKFVGVESSVNVLTTELLLLLLMLLMIFFLLLLMLVAAGLTSIERWEEDLLDKEEELSSSKQ